MRLGSHIAVALARPAAVAPIQPLAWEPPCAMGAALKTKKNKNNKNQPARKLASRIVWEHGGQSNHLTQDGQNILRSESRSADVSGKWGEQSGKNVSGCKTGLTNLAWPVV